MEKKKKKIDEIDEIEVEEEELTSEDDDFGKTKNNNNKKVVDNDKDEPEEEYVELTMEDRIANIENKVNTNLIISVITIILVIITMVFSMTDKKTSVENNDTATNADASQQASTATYSTKSFNEITAKEIAQVSKGKAVLIMIGRQGCGYCAAYAPILEALQADYDFVTQYIDLDKMIARNGDQAYISDEDSYDALVELTGKDYDGWVKENFGKTPMTLIVKDNKILYGGLGALEDSTLKTQFEKVGISKK